MSFSFASSRFVGSERGVQDDGPVIHDGPVIQVDGPVIHSGPVIDDGRRFGISFRLSFKRRLSLQPRRGRLCRRWRIISIQQDS